jgi:hypothetical protein
MFFWLRIVRDDLMPASIAFLRTDQAAPSMGTTHAGVYLLSDQVFDDRDLLRRIGSGRANQAGVNTAVLAPLTTPCSIRLTS